MPIQTDLFPTALDDLLKMPEEAFLAFLKANEGKVLSLTIPSEKLEQITSEDIAILDKATVAGIVEVRAQ